MLQKKVCMLGYFAVGKTSLVRRCVESIFSEQYITTIGVKIDKKTLTVSEKEVTLVVWDVYGEDNQQSVMPAYLRGMAGYLLVVDPTRPNTVKKAEVLNNRVRETVGNLPFVLVKNKSDLKENWITEDSDLAALENTASAVIETSAKNDSNVDETFESLASAILAANKSHSE